MLLLPSCHFQTQHKITMLCVAVSYEHLKIIFFSLQGFPAIDAGIAKVGGYQCCGHQTIWSRFGSGIWRNFPCLFRPFPSLLLTHSLPLPLSENESNPLLMKWWYLLSRSNPSVSGICRNFGCQFVHFRLSCSRVNFPSLHLKMEVPPSSKWNDDIDDPFVLSSLLHIPPFFL